jgi:hypothetical protein
MAILGSCENSTYERVMAICKAGTGNYPLSTRVFLCTLVDTSRSLGTGPRCFGEPLRIGWNNRSIHRLSSADAGGGLVSHRRFYLFIAGIWIGGGLMLWAAIHLMHAYAFD